MKNKRIRGFNLIEVTMAIAIVGIGIAGVMALFPPAIEANKNANFQNFSGTMVNNVAAYLDYQLKTDWSTFKGKLNVKGSATLPSKETNPDNWTEIPGFTGVYKTSQNQDDLLGIKSEDGSIAAHVRIWQDNSNMDAGYFGQSPVTIDKTNNYRIRVVIELSWPIAKDYDNGKSGSEYKVLRETQEFIYEFNKPE